MTRQAFILSDCEFSECGEKPYALLTANPTKEHHYIAQTEQRQHAHNPQVSPQNQNVYKLPLSMFREPTAARRSRSGDKVRSGSENRGAAASVNIIGNLAAKNLYTLTFVENTANQYNLESWFNRHESGYEEACNHLRTLPVGRLKTGEPDTVKVPEALWRILRLKFLGILRNPHNHKNLFAHRLHEAVRARLPEVGFEFVRLISKRDPSRIEAIMQNYRFSFLGYVDWLAGLYGMLSEGVMQPSLFERMFRAAFARPDAVRIELYRYPQGGQCLFPDRSFCVQTTSQLVNIGVGIAADMFATVRIRQSRWRELKHSFHLAAAPLHGTVHIRDGSQTRRLAFNRLCIAQAHRAVFGQSPEPQDYL